MRLFKAIAGLFNGIRSLRRTARWMDMTGYYKDRHGSIRRVSPKRDKSMSARQWKKLVKAARRQSLTPSGCVD